MLRAEAQTKVTINQKAEAAIRVSVIEAKLREANKNLVKPISAISSNFLSATHTLLVASAECITISCDVQTDIDWKPLREKGTPAVHFTREIPRHFCVS